MADESHHPVFTPPDDPTTKIWRHMDFTKFVSMLENEGLFFARVDCLDDPFEGSYARGNEAIRNLIPEEYRAHPFVFGQMRSAAKWLSQRVVVNCWHMSEYESAAMWKLYARTEEAICIQSTYERLRHCLPNKVYIGQVKYIDYEREYIPEGNLFWPFMHKRRSFEHERELRAVTVLWPRESGALPESGIWVRVDLNHLIEKIYVAPAAPPWFSDLASKVVARYALDKPVIQSSLNAEPFY